MKVGEFDISDLLIDTKNNLLIHKPSGCSTRFYKTGDEFEDVIRLNDALKQLELRYGLYLIDQL